MVMMERADNLYEVRRLNNFWDLLSELAEVFSGFREFDVLRTEVHAAVANGGVTDELAEALDDFIESSVFEAIIDWKVERSIKMFADWLFRTVDYYREEGKAEIK